MRKVSARVPTYGVGRACCHSCTWLATALVQMNTDTYPHETLQESERL
jgi:hypothetical protein